MLGRLENQDFNEEVLKRPIFYQLIFTTKHTYIQEGKMLL